MKQRIEASHSTSN